MTADSAGLSGSLALIMGAPADLARALALRFATAGADVALTTATSDAAEAFELRRVTKTVTDLGRDCLIEGVDMTIGTGVQITVRQVAKAFGRIDLLVVASDLQLTRPAERLSDAEWSKLLGLNLSSVFYACRAVAREMFRLEPVNEVRGRIIVLTRQAQPEDGAAYRAAKAGLTGLVEALDDEWASKGVSAGLVVRGDTDDEDADKFAAKVFELATSAK
jgi:NAD(P)-dependent dehydrogenase (short-subunit alcohol dehydrogenase family)